MKPPLANSPRETCDWAGCLRPPVWRVGLKIWAKGYPKTSTPIRGEIGIFVCDECGRERVKASHFLPETMRANIELTASRLRKATPDFDTAEVDLLPILRLEGR